MVPIEVIEMDVTGFIIGAVDTILSEDVEVCGFRFFSVREYAK
jgi:hypothetical protein